MENRRFSTIRDSISSTLSALTTRDSEDSWQSSWRKEDLVTFKLRGFATSIKLAKIRLVLVLAHLVVLSASCISFFAWIDAKYNWQVDQSDENYRTVLSPLPPLPALPDNDKKLLISVHGYMEQVLLFTSVNLLLFWLIYGVVLACRFGEPCDICSLVLSLPHSVLMVIWQAGVAIVIFRMLSILHQLPLNPEDYVSPKAFHHLSYVREFYLSWAPWVAALYLLACPVQVGTNLLPFLIHRLPFQDMAAKLRFGRIGNNCNDKMAARSTENKPVLPDMDNDSEDREESDYVGAEQISGEPARDEVLSLYHCEMPHEKMAKSKLQVPLSGRIRRISWRAGQTTSRAVLDTMTRVCSSSTLPAWTALADSPIVTSGSGDVALYPYDDNVAGDYMHMRAVSEPATVRLLASECNSADQAADFSALTNRPVTPLTNSGSCPDPSLSYSAGCPDSTLSYSGSCPVPSLSYSAGCPDPSLSYSGSCPDPSLSYSGSCPDPSLSYSDSCPISSFSFSDNQPSHFLSYSGSSTSGDSAYATLTGYLDSSPPEPSSETIASDVFLTNGYYATDPFATSSYPQSISVPQSSVYYDSGSCAPFSTYPRSFEAVDPIASACIATSADPDRYEFANPLSGQSYPGAGYYTYGGQVTSCRSVCTTPPVASPEDSRTSAYGLSDPYPESVYSFFV